MLTCIVKAATVSLRHKLGSIYPPWLPIDGDSWAALKCTCLALILTQLSSDETREFPSAAELLYSYLVVPFLARAVLYI